MKVAQSCLTLCAVHGILQARILEWVAFPFSRGSFQPRDQTQVSCIAGRIFSSWATREAPILQIRTQEWPEQWIPFPMSHTQEVAELVLKLIIFNRNSASTQNTRLPGTCQKIERIFYRISKFHRNCVLHEKNSINIRIYSMGI